MNLFVRTFGCQMNFHDSLRLVEMLTREGYDRVEKPGEADLIVVNTCSVREKAWHKAISEAGRMCTYKERNPKLVVALSGCVAQQEKARLFKHVDALDLVIGPDCYQQLPALVEQVRSGGRRQVAAVGFDSGNPDDFLAALEEQGRSRLVTSYVTVMKGCSEHCAYCIVPAVRGPERSRPSADIMREARLLTESGCVEITLLGQKVNAYREGETRFAQLLHRLNALEHVERLRFTSPHPKHMTDDVIACFAELESLCEAVHLPVQSGSTRVLERMRRRYTAERYLEIVAQLRRAQPAVHISTDLIVGFPGETEEDFRATLRMLEDVRFSGVFSFKYSPRPGTRAATSLEDDVPREVKAERLERAHEVIEKHERRIRSSLEGETLEVLVEGISKRGGQLTGRARNNQIVNFDISAGVEPRTVIGSLVQVRVEEGLPHSLRGTLVDER